MIFENGGVTASVASEAQILRYCNVAAVAFLVYDLLIHFGDEVELIWKSRNTWVKWIYIYLRYYGAVIIGILVLQGNTTIRFTPQSCLNWFIAESVISNSIILVTETMLLIRVWAIYGKNKMILYILCAASTAEAITVLVTTIKAFQTAKVSLDLGCILVYVPPILSAAWAASLGFQTIIFGLTIGRWLTHLIITKQLGRRSVMYVLVRDGGWAYGVMFVVFLVNLLTFRLSTSPLASVVFRWAMAMASFTGAHVLLNLRRLGSHINEDFMSHPSTTGLVDAGGIVFAPRREITTVPATALIELEDRSFSEERERSKFGEDVC